MIDFYGTNVVDNVVEANKTECYMNDELERILTEASEAVSNEATKTDESYTVVTKPITSANDVFDYNTLHPQTRHDIDQCFQVITEQKDNIQQITETLKSKIKVIEKKNTREQRLNEVLETMKQQKEQLVEELKEFKEKTTPTTCEQYVQTEQIDDDGKEEVDDDTVEERCCDHMDVQQKYEKLLEQCKLLKQKNKELAIVSDNNRLKRHAVEQTLTDGLKKFKNSVLESFDEMETRQKVMNDQKNTIQEQKKLIAELQRQNTVLYNSYKQSKECVNSVNDKFKQSQNVVNFYKNKYADIRQKYDQLTKK
uniref:Uncharacterized protein n=1 Tax=Erinnyis ello granulovirus TaxID=307444 RepID=A0A288WII7_9BBAC|nr:hypothetical protein EREL_029 [Erinnyis ello granulovirus]